MAQIQLDSTLPQTITKWAIVLPGLYPSQVPLVTDCIIIGANGPAAELYGYESPDLLVGEPLSQRRSLTETEHARWGCVLAKTRTGASLQRRFCTEIIRPDGERVMVMKSATTLELHGETVWVTTFEHVAYGEVRRGFDPKDYSGIDQRDVLRHCGPYSIATARPLLEAGLPTLTASDALASIIPETVQVNNLQNVNAAQIRGPGDVWSRWLYWCERCCWLWFGKAQRPRQCPNQTCRSEIWWRPRVP